MADFPRTKIEDLSVSRLVMGTNWWLGFSHTSKAKDAFILEYHTPERIADVMEVFLAEGIDHLGLDHLDRKLLKIVVEYYKGGPVGIEALAATLNEEVDTLVDMVEPYLLKIGFVQRTRRGRVVSDEAIKHIGMQPPKNGQQTLF